MFAIRIRRRAIRIQAIAVEPAEELSDLADAVPSAPPHILHPEGYRSGRTAGLAGHAGERELARKEGAPKGPADETSSRRDC